MNPVQYIFANRGLNMTPGKMAAQVAHAAVLSSEWSRKHAPAGLGIDMRLVGGQALHEVWLDSGHYTKIILDARDTEHLFTVDRYLRDRGVETFMVIDEGRTEISPHTPTALGVQLVDKDDPRTAEIFGHFDLFPSPKRWPRYR